MLIRFFLTMSFYIVAGRWFYAEAINAMPQSQPYIDSVLEMVSIPTHDKWDTTGLESMVSELTQNSPRLQKMAKLSIHSSDTELSTF